MKTPLLLALSLVFALAAATPASAYCGVIEKSASGKTVQIAQKRANKAMKYEVQKLKRQNGAKLQLDARQVACIAGALAIDANGNQTEGDSSCTLTQPFCVNP
jgi:hypothetical protein